MRSIFRLTAPTTPHLLFFFSPPYAYKISRSLNNSLCTQLRVEMASDWEAGEFHVCLTIITHIMQQSNFGTALRTLFHHKALTLNALLLLDFFPIERVVVMPYALLDISICVSFSSCHVQRVCEASTLINDANADTRPLNPLKQQKATVQYH